LAKEASAAQERGDPTPKKVRLGYTCKKCGKPQTKETGHSQYYGQSYCPNKEGQIPREQWLKQKESEKPKKKNRK
jgi:hypothetical protein